MKTCFIRASRKREKHRVKSHKHPQFTEAIEHFWSQIRGGASRIDLLVKAASWKAGGKSNYFSRRRSAPKFRGQKGAKCWSCQQEPPKHLHHIIQLQYGGRNSPRNLVPLCKYCHAIIHPWLRKDAHPVIAPDLIEVSPKDDKQLWEC